MFFVFAITFFSFVSRALRGPAGFPIAICFLPRKAPFRQWRGRLSWAGPRLNFINLIDLFRKPQQDQIFTTNNKTPGGGSLTEVIRGALRAAYKVIRAEEII